MAEPTTLYPTPTRLALLADVRDLKVADDEDGAPQLDLGNGETARVASAIWEMERPPACWVYQIPDGLAWRLTQRGLDILEGRH